MSTLTNSSQQKERTFGRGFRWDYFLEDNLTGSWLQTVGVTALAIVTGWYTYAQYKAHPTATKVILAAWVVGLVMVIWGELAHRHNRVSRWLHDNLFSSIANSLLTLLLTLVLAAAAQGFWQWGVVNASFDPDKTAPEFRPENGATWGVIWGARKLLMTGTLEPKYHWRVWLSLWYLVGMWLVTYVTGRPKIKEKVRPLRLVVNALWLLSPIILYIFLAGVPDKPFSVKTAAIGAGILLVAYAILWWQKVVSFSWQSVLGTAVVWPVAYAVWWQIGKTGVFEPINVDTWGGLLLTLIIASAVIVLSLPLGILLALGRRSQVFGIPRWILWPGAIGVTLWGLVTSTPGLLETSRNTFEKVTSFWPLIILGLAYLLDRMFQGNLVAGASTAFIELIRSVPLITLLFMGINMAPFFLKAGTDVAKPWPVIVGYTLFASAYMAETVRGGLQAIPKGQYEAADALGFNAMQKMRFIIMPQALRIVIPAIVGQFIGAYKSSSLVAIVGLFDFMGINRVIASNPQWLGLRIELYLFIGFVYFIGSYMMSSYSRRLEKRLGVGER